MGRRPGNPNAQVRVHLSLLVNRFSDRPPSSPENAWPQSYSLDRGQRQPAVWAAPGCWELPFLLTQHLLPDNPPRPRLQEPPTPPVMRPLQPFRPVRQRPGLRHRTSGRPPSSSPAGQASAQSSDTSPPVPAPSGECWETELGRKEAGTRGRFRDTESQRTVGGRFSLFSQSSKSYPGLPTRMAGEIHRCTRPTVRGSGVAGLRGSKVPAFC